MGGRTSGDHERDPDDLASIDETIVVLEAQREVLGDAVIDTAVGPLLERRAVLGGRLAGEQRKLVTVLFSDLVDFTALSGRLDAEDVRRVVNAYFVRWHEQIEANGGIVEKFIGDAVMAVFGLYQSREHDAHCAVRAALGMKEVLEELNAELGLGHGETLTMRVGIDTGEVVVSTLDERFGGEFVAVGETVNRASRLQGAAPPGGVLISSDTYRHVRGSFGFEPMAGLRLKGIVEPVDAYLVLAERPRGFRLDAARGVEGVETRTIGRELELRQLQDHFSDVVEEGQWQVVTIVGDAGVGKSRLLGEFDRWLAETPEPLWWFRGRASPSDQNLPNALLRDVIAHRLDIQDSDGAEIVREKWERGFERVLGSSETARYKAHVIARWLGFGPGEIDSTLGSNLTSQVLRDRAIAHMAECFQRLAEQSPVVALLEDLHWADDGSLAWIDAAHPFLAASRVLVVATARPALLERHPLWGEGLSFHTRLTLQSLSQRHSRQLLGEILQKVEHVPSSLRDLVVTAADGNPFYIEELVKWLLEAGVITTEAETWRVLEDRIDSVRVPPTLRGVLQARLDAFPPTEGVTLQRAAVIGRVFWDDAVRSLGHEPASGTGGGSAVGDSLDHLRAREVVYEREQSAFEETREFSFKHALLRDVAYDSVLKAHRRTYHAQAAQWLEQRSARTCRLDQFAGLVAGHYDQAGDSVAAGRSYLRAGQQAASVHALTEATRLLTRALEVVPDGEAVLRFDLLLAREAVLERLGVREAQRADVIAMEGLLPHLDDANRRIQLLLCRIRWAFNDSDYVAEAKLASEAVELARDAGLADAEVEARSWWGKGLAWQGDHAAARQVLEEALAGARVTHQPRLIGETLRYLAMVANNQSDFPRAATLLEEARTVHRQDNDPEGEGLVLGQLATVFYSQSRYRQAKACLEESLPIFTASGYKYRLAIATSNLATIALTEGELGAARRLIAEGLQLSREVGDRESTGTGLGILGDIYRQVGDLEHAEAYSHEALDAATEIGYTALASDASLGLALVAAERGRHEDAARFANDAVDFARQAESPLAEARAVLAHGTVLLRARHVEAADSSLRSCVQKAEQFGLANLALEARAGLARAAVQRNDLGEAMLLIDRLFPDLSPVNLQGCLQPGEVYSTCWQVLNRCHDPRAATVLLAASTYIDETAARIDEDDLRDGFLNHVPAHVELARARRETTEL